MSLDTYMENPPPLKAPPPPIPKRIFQHADRYEKGDWSHGEQVRGEAFERCEIVTQEEAWDLVWDSYHFDNAVTCQFSSEPTESDLKHARARLRRHWRAAGLDAHEWLHLRADGYVEVEDW